MQSETTWRRRRYSGPLLSDWIDEIRRRRKSVFVFRNELSVDINPSAELECSEWSGKSSLLLGREERFVTGKNGLEEGP